MTRLVCGIVGGILALQACPIARADATPLHSDSNPLLDEKQGIFGLRFGEIGAAKELSRAGCDLVFNVPFSRLEERGERESPGMRTTIGKGIWKCDDSFNIRDQRVSASFSVVGDQIQSVYISIPNNPVHWIDNKKSFQICTEWLEVLDVAWGSPTVGRSACESAPSISEIWNLPKLPKDQSAVLVAPSQVYPCEEYPEDIEVQGDVWNLLEPVNPAVEKSILAYWQGGEILAFLSGNYGRDLSSCSLVLEHLGTSSRFVQSHERYLDTRKKKVEIWADEL